MLSHCVNDEDSCHICRLWHGEPVSEQYGMPPHDFCNSHLGCRCIAVPFEEYARCFDMTEGDTMAKESDDYPLTDTGIHHDELMKRLDETNRLLSLIAE